MIGLCFSFSCNSNMTQWIFSLERGSDGQGDKMCYQWINVQAFSNSMLWRLVSLHDTLNWSRRTLNGNVDSATYLISFSTCAFLAFVRS